MDNINNPSLLIESGINDNSNANIPDCGKEIKDIIGKMRSYLKSFITDSEFYSERANGHFCNKEYEKAIEDMNEAIALSPNNSKYYARRAICYNNLHSSQTAKDEASWKKVIAENKGKAIADMHYAIFLDPGINSFYNNLAGYYYGNNDYEKAIEVMSQVILKAPDNIDYYAKRAFYYFCRGEDEKALMDYMTIIKKTPKCGKIYYDGILKVCSRNKDFIRAIQDLTRVIQLAPKNPYGYYIRGLLYYEYDRFDNATGDFSKSIDLYPNAEFYYRRALSYIESGVDKLALKDCDTAMSLVKDHWDCIRLRSRIFIKLGDLKSAFKDLNKLIKISPLTADNYIHRAKVYERRGNVKKAIEDCLKAFDLDALIYNKSEKNRKILAWITSRIK